LISFHSRVITDFYLDLAFLVLQIVLGVSQQLSRIVLLVDEIWASVFTGNMKEFSFGRPPSDRAPLLLTDLTEETVCVQRENMTLQFIKM
jgi:hypothetical protein